VNGALIEMWRSMPRAFELLSPEQDFLSLGFGEATPEIGHERF